VLIFIGAALTLVFWDGMRALGRRRQSAAFDEVRFLSAISADLRSGASVRSAIGAAAGNEHVGSLQTARRLAMAGAPLGDVAVVLEGLAVNGRSVAAALRVIEAAGGRSADVFAGLADRAMAEVDRRREQRALTTQVRLSAAVVGGLPILALVFGGYDRIGALLRAGSGGVAVAVVGLGMQLAGIGIVWRLAKA
jgi:Flp pilus assembly protein TadB